MYLRKIHLFLFHFAWVIPAFSQKELALNLVNDEYCSYVQLSCQNIQTLLAANDTDFKDFMEKNGFRKVELGQKNEYMAVSPKLNHVRLLSKDTQAIRFTFSPLSDDLPKKFLTDINTYARLISSSQKGNKTSITVEFPSPSPNQYYIQWEEKKDTEEYVGRTIVVKTLVVEVKQL